MSGGSPFDDLAPLLSVTTLVGLLVRRRIGDCLPFAAYLGLSVFMRGLMNLSPEPFAALQIWELQASLSALLTLLIVADLGWVARANLWSGRRITTFAVAGMGVALVIFLGKLVSGFVLRGSVVPSLDTYLALAWGTAIAALYPYRLALLPLQRAIRLGLVLYVVASIAMHWTLDALGRGTEAPYVTALHSAASCATLALWAWAAWDRRESSGSPAIPG